MFNKRFPKWEEIGRRVFGNRELVLFRRTHKPSLMIDLIETFGKSEVSIGGRIIIRYSTEHDQNLWSQHNLLPLEIVNTFYEIKSEEDLGKLRSAAWEKDFNCSDESHLEVALYQIQNK